MAAAKFKIQFYALVAVPVALAVIAALALSGLAVVENLRFINATNQILGLVGTTRSLLATQKNLAQIPGENIWTDLAQAGQIPLGASPVNPWQGEVRATVATPVAMRIETDVPTHDCRRLALYFIEHHPSDLGLLTIEAQAMTQSAWRLLYPAADHAPELACNGAAMARLALVFKIRDP